MLRTTKEIFTEGNEGKEEVFILTEQIQSSFSSLPSINLSSMHPLYEKANKLSSEVIGAAIEVHRDKGVQG